MLTVPFSIDNLKKIISGELQTPEIDLSLSTIKNQTLLTYLYNLNIKDLKINFENLSIQEKRDLFLSYLNHKSILEITNFSETYLKFLFNLKDIVDLDEDAQEILQSSIFTDSEISQLMSNDAELREAIEHAAFVLDGIIIHLILNTNDVKIKLDEEFGKIGIHKDPNWIGHTWVNLLKHPVFNSYYYSKMPELKEMVYFPYQYCEPIYKGKPLFDFLNESVVVTTLYEMSLGLDKTEDPVT